MVFPGHRITLYPQHRHITVIILPMDPNRGIRRYRLRFPSAYSAREPEDVQNNGHSSGRVFSGARTRDTRKHLLHRRADTWPNPLERVVYARRFATDEDSDLRVGIPSLLTRPLEKERLATRGNGAITPRCCFILTISTGNTRSHRMRRMIYVERTFILKTADNVFRYLLSRKTRMRTVCITLFSRHHRRDIFEGKIVLYSFRYREYNMIIKYENSSF